MVTLIGFWSGLALGLAIGWSMPQPLWVKEAWDKLKAKYTK